jgi:hypothetical protein
LGQIAQLMRMRTITVEILLLSRASVLGTLPKLAQIRVDVLVGVIAPQRALISCTAARPVACRGYGDIVYISS